MNIRYKNPEVIARIRTVNPDVDDIDVRDKVVAFDVVLHGPGQTPILQLDIREFGKNRNLIVEIELSEAVLAISHATVNKEA